MRRNSPIAIALPLATLLLCAALPSTGTAQQPEVATFSNAIVARDADRLKASVSALADTEAGKRAAREPAGSIRAAAEKALEDAKDIRGALRQMNLAAAVDAKDRAAWLGIAQAALAIPADDLRSSERYELPSSASGAAWLAYGLSRTPEEKAESLEQLAEALKRRSMWRPAIDALKASIALAPEPDREEALEALRAEHGFRVVDYKVDSDAEAPRLCVNFSEKLAVATPEAGKFVTLDGREPEAISAEGNQLCLDGLKHGARYEIQVRAGIPSDTAETLAKSSEIAIYVRDRKPSVRLTGRAYVLPSRGQQGIPVTSVNTKALDVAIYRIGDRALALAAGSDNFLRTIESWDIDQVREKSGHKVWSGTLEVASRLNQDVTTAIPVTDALGKLEPGVYVVSAGLTGPREGEGQQQTSAAQWFVVSDLGLTTLSGDDGLHTFVRSIATTASVPGVRVRLLARNNEVLGTATTDAKGYARFEPGLLRGEGGHAPRLVVAQGKEDYGLLDLATAAFDLSDRGVKGRTAPGPVDGYLYAERGVYRPGETVNLTGLLRTASGSAATAPATLVVTRPDGVEHRRVVLNDQGLGGRTTALLLGRQSMTGTWRAKLHADPKAAPLAEAAFLVEDFVPERLALDLKPAATSVRAGESASVTVNGRYLYGPPAAGLAIEGEIVVRAAKADLPGLAGYRFGNAAEKLPAVRETLDNLGVTGANGEAVIAAGLPRLPRTTRPLEAEVMLRLRESGGRAIERKVTLSVDPAEARIGVKPLFANDQVGEGDEAQFDIVALAADGKRARQSLKWEIVRLDRRWQWYSHEGEWRHEPVTTTRRISSGTVDATAEAPARIAFKPDWGRYRLDVTGTEPGGPRSSVLFSTGWQSADNADSPEVLDVALDKAAYQAGDTARLKITSREAGRALVAVVSGGLLSTQEVEVPKGGTEVAIPVDGKWLPGAYVAATLYRALDEGQKRMPGRAMGLAWLGLDAKPATLGVTISAPEKALPGRPLAVPMRLAGLVAGEEARVTVAAVDVGILNLTRYEAPAPEKWFHAQRRLGIELRDLYGRLIDGMRADRGRLRSGGDGSGGMSAEGSPPVEAPLSLFSGIVKVGADGNAQVSFDLPDFNGTVRLMAVAWSGSKVGSATRDVIVRDKLALTVSGPRFLTLGDKARLEVDVHNVDGPAAGYQMKVVHEPEAGAKLSLSGVEMALKPAERRRESVALQPAALGRSVYDVAVTGPDGIEVRRRLALEVVPPASGIRRSIVSSLAPQSRLSVSKDLFHDLIPSSARLSLIVGPTAAFDVAGLLGALDKYPYGCAEQTTSRALPLLYVNDMARRLGLAEEAEIKSRIAKAIDRLMEMQDSSGAFGAWGPSDADTWLTAYVTDFLTRARESGYEVRREPYTQALDRLANGLAYAQDFEKGGEARAYALYVLARNGRAPVGDLRYYADTRLDRFATPLAKAQLGAALAMVGDKDRAGRAFASALADLDGTQARAALDGARADYGSLVRDGAAILTLVAETGVVAERKADLTKVLAAAFRARQSTSTQEQAWMLLAARALADDAKSTTLTVGGVAHTGELTRSVRPAEIESRPLEVINGGQRPVDAVMTVEGSSLIPEPAVANKGFIIERAYYTLDGKPVELASASGGKATLAQNDRLVVVVSIKGTDRGGRVLAVDRLPAGLEVENPRLVDSGDVKSLSWLKRVREPKHTEFRDDRVVAAFDFFGSSEGQATSEPVAASFAYIARAVTPGTFVHPAATVEDMYRPERFARTASGTLEIGAK